MKIAPFLIILLPAQLSYRLIIRDAECPIEAELLPDRYVVLLSIGTEDDGLIKLCG